MERGFLGRWPLDELDERWKGGRWADRRHFGCRLIDGWKVGYTRVILKWMHLRLWRVGWSKSIWATFRSKFLKTWDVWNSHKPWDKQVQLVSRILFINGREEMELWPFFFFVKSWNHCRQYPGCVCVCFFPKGMRISKLQNRWHSFSAFFSSETYDCSQMLLKRGINGY